jgi:lipoprotein-releasing system ATP-binding protein
VASDGDRPILHTVDLAKCYGNGVVTWALRGINLEVRPGEFVAVVGASGSGKSTLLNVAGALDRPSRGEVHIDGRDTRELDDTALAALRGDTIGFIFQFHYLLGEFSVLENALMPLAIRKGWAGADDIRWVKTLLARVGLEDRMDARPSQLSGGQQQRAAIVRALANRPRLILADEPTGNLDSRSGAMVFELLTELNFQLGTAFILVTHDDRLAQQAQRIVAMEDGHIVADYRVAEVEEEFVAVKAGQSTQGKPEHPAF